MAVETGRVALVTGASAGIGEAAASALVGAGFTATDQPQGGRRRDAGGVVFLPLDITDDESVAGAVREVLDRSGRIDVLVNNAGVGVPARRRRARSSRPARCSRPMSSARSARRARCCRTCESRAAAGHQRQLRSRFLPAPFMALYAATKHAIEGYSESLDHEVRDHGVRVLLVEPAYTRTSFDANAVAVDEPLALYARRREASEVLTRRRRPKGRRRTRRRGRDDRRRGHRHTSETAIPGRNARAPGQQAAPLRALGPVRQADPQDQPARRLAAVLAAAAAPRK